MPMYKRTYWRNHVKDQSGTVIQQGTRMDQDHFNNMEIGISDQAFADDLLWFLETQRSYELVDEQHTVTLGQTGNPWPFNNSPSTVALSQLRENINYAVKVDVLAYSGGQLGSIKVYDRARNGFKLLHDGSATSVQVSVRVSGGLLT